MKLRIFSLIAILIGIAYSPITTGQCTGPYCSPSSPSIYGGTYPGEYGSPPVNPEQFSVSQEVLERIRKASVIVENQVSTRMSIKGSGTIVKYNESVFIVTAGHVVESASEVLVISDYIGRVRCRTVVSDRSTDYAVVEPLERQEEFYALAVNWYTPRESSVLRTNIPVVLAGFDGGTQVRIRKSYFYRYTETSGTSYANWMVLSGASYSGDSGGGVFNTDGELVGIIWGTDQRTTIATWIAPVQTTCLRPGLFRWRRPARPPSGPAVPNNPEDVRPSPVPPHEHPGPVNPPETKPENPAPPKQEPEQPPKEEEQEPNPIPRESFGELILRILGPSIYVMIGFVAFLFTITLTRLVVFFRFGR
ncbi:MAG: hypothetical protein KatS3mg087_0119 [Patescibacteria group bacterium]|nr:MAG: hypothetical protein KatS3mg087_0119 [Patescibacteria group bacterium]